MRLERLKPGAKVNGWAFTQFDGTVRWDKSGILSMNGQGTEFDSLREWIAFQRKLKTPTAPGKIAAIIKKEPSAISAEERTEATNYFIEHGWKGKDGRRAAIVWMD